MATVTRLYKVFNTADQTTRLIDATTSAQALHHCAKSTFQIEVCKAKDVAALLTAGAAVEKAAAEPAK